MKLWTTRLSGIPMTVFGQMCKKEICTLNYFGNLRWVRTNRATCRGTAQVWPTRALAWGTKITPNLRSVIRHSMHASCFSRTPAAAFQSDSPDFIFKNCTAAWFARSSFFKVARWSNPRDFQFFKMAMPSACRNFFRLSTHPIHRCTLR